MTFQQSSRRRPRRAATVVAVLTTLLLGLASPAQAGGGSGLTSGADPAVVTTSKGKLRGEVKPGYRVFRGIPYAAPPVGELRWMPPKPAPRWSGVRDATKPGTMCPQDAGPQNPPSLDENCLFAGVTVPDRRSAAKRLPVIVWIHGGGGTGGSGDWYDPNLLAQRGDVVVVTINYRLGMLANLAHPALPQSGHLNIADQQEALRWVKRDIAAFGGDPGNVTIMGESAGGSAICGQLASPSAAGLFHRAIIQSGLCYLTGRDNEIAPGAKAAPANPDVTDYTGGRAAAAALGCADAATAAACLRARPVDKLLATQTSHPDMGYLATSRVLPVPTRRALETGAVNRVPVLIGATAEEGTLFVYFGYDLAGKPVTAEQYPDLVRWIYGDDATEVLKRYPVSAYRSPGTALAAAQTDHVWICPSLTAAGHLARKAPVYNYEFADPAPPLWKVVPLAGPTHGSELQYLRLLDGSYSDPSSFTAGQRVLSNQMIDYWTRFARSGDPNGAGTPRWKRLDPRLNNAQELAPGSGGIRRIDQAKKHNCAFWAEADRP
ncbi:carboxylesterase family protein [Streptosporangium sp. NPDC006013]|uniref:carboxylesterase/lipase family protein n=1 Tax=Streptosporangium sp. NPDC006013 TaxID=3155596 RepID=UPI0033B81EC4